MSLGTTKDTFLIGPKALLRKMKIYTFDASRELRAMADEIGTISCKKGCDNCCRQKVLSTPGEGLPIYLHAYATRMSHDEWFRERRPCPFLRGGACSVYPVRPVGCITTFSTNDPKYCGDSEVQPGTGQMQINAPSAPAMLQLMTLLVMVERGIPSSGYMTLAGAVLAGARHATGREPRAAFSIPIGGGEPGLIESFDAGGKVFGLEGAGDGRA